MHSGLQDPIHRRDQDVIRLGITCRQRSLDDRIYPCFTCVWRVIFLWLDLFHKITWSHTYPRSFFLFRLVTRRQKEIKKASLWRFSC